MKIRVWITKVYLCIVYHIAYRYVYAKVLWFVTQKNVKEKVYIYIYTCTIVHFEDGSIVSRKEICSQKIRSDTYSKHEKKI